MLECVLTNTIQMSEHVGNRISSNHTHTSHNFTIKIIQIRKCFKELCSFGNYLLHLLAFYWNLASEYFAYMSFSGFLFSCSQLCLFFHFACSQLEFYAFFVYVSYSPFMFHCLYANLAIHTPFVRWNQRDFWISLLHRCKSAEKWFNSSNINGFCFILLFLQQSYNFLSLLGIFSFTFTRSLQCRINANGDEN